MRPKMQVKKINEDLYFSDPKFFGSTEYSTFKTSGESGLAEYVLSSRLEKTPNQSLIFGTLLHKILSGEVSLCQFETAKTATTTLKGLDEMKIGSSDKCLAERIVEKFPIDLNKIKDFSEFFEIETGYFFEFLDFKLRAKPDLLFKLPFSNELVIVDWKTTSNFFRGNFEEKYRFQALFYAFLFGKIHACEKVRHVLFWISKTPPFAQWTETFVFDKNELTDDFFCNDLKIMKSVFENPNEFAKKNVNVNDMVLNEFLK